MDDRLNNKNENYGVATLTSRLAPPQKGKRSYHVAQQFYF